MKNENKQCMNVEQMQEGIPVFEIIDPYGYVHSNKVIAHIKIKGTNGNKKRELIRTKKGGYVMYA